MTRYIFITGGVVSSLGKGITAASLGCLLKKRGLRVSMQKLDPYINYDPGTMNPYQHGEVFVTEDGTETDLDLGHYERFINENLGASSNVTTGKVYQSVLGRERKGFYQGSTVQVIPHITDSIKENISKFPPPECDVAMVEVGGTVGDIESLPFLEAIRQLKAEWGEQRAIYVHVTLIPRLYTTGELKTKPTQHSVKELRSIGIQPDLLVCRSDFPLTQEIKEKVALYSDVLPQEVIENTSCDNIYQVPLQLQKQRMDDMALNKLELTLPPADLGSWRSMINKFQHFQEEVTIGLVGKYVSLKDAYISILEALFHGGIEDRVRVHVPMISAEDLEKEEQLPPQIEAWDGLVIPGGFGERGIEGKIEAARYARENEIPFLGLCLGMQCSVIEFARNVVGLKGAHSTEFSPHTPYPVIHLLPSQSPNTPRGGSMRLGSYQCNLKEDTLASQVYSQFSVMERHRHRYEFNNDYLPILEKYGLIASGFHPQQQLVEMVELKHHPWYLGVQFHPEFKSRPETPHPLFRELVMQALNRKNKKKKS